MAILTAVAAGATSLEARVIDAYIGGAVMLAAATAIALLFILPRERKHRRVVLLRRPENDGVS